MTGLGFDGVPTPAELDSIERAFSVRGAPTQVELAHLADPAVGEMLTVRGYRLESFENVLGQSLDEPQTLVPLPGIDIRPSPDDEFDTWLAVMADAVAQPDTQGLAWHEEFPRTIYEEAMRDEAVAGVRRYAAVRGAPSPEALGFGSSTGSPSSPALLPSPPIVAAGSRTPSCRCA